MDEILFTKVKNGITYECEKCRISLPHFPNFVMHLQQNHKFPLISKCKECQKATVQRNISEEYFKDHLCYNFHTIDQQAASVSIGMGSIPAISQLKSMQEVYQQNSQLEIANKRASPTPSPTNSNKKPRTSVDSMDNSISINELIEIK